MMLHVFKKFNNRRESSLGGSTFLPRAKEEPMDSLNTSSLHKDKSLEADPSKEDPTPRLAKTSQEDVRSRLATRLQSFRPSFRSLSFSCNIDVFQLLNYFTAPSKLNNTTRASDLEWEIDATAKGDIISSVTRLLEFWLDQDEDRTQAAQMIVISRLRSKNIEIPDFLYKILSCTKSWFERSKTEDLSGILILLQGIIYMKRLRKKGTIVLTRTNVNNLVSMLCFIAAKFHEDTVIKTEYWCSVFGYPDHQDFNQIILALLELLDWKTFCSAEDLMSLSRELKIDHQICCIFHAHHRLTTSSTSSLDI